MQPSASSLIKVSLLGKKRTKIVTLSYFSQPSPLDGCGASSCPWKIFLRAPICLYSKNCSYSQRCNHKKCGRLEPSTAIAFYMNYSKIVGNEFRIRAMWKWQKTKVQNLGFGDPESDMTLYGNAVEGVTEFCYLCSIQSSSGRSRADILRRIGIASSAMHSMQRVWRQHRLSLSTKLTFVANKEMK